IASTIRQQNVSPVRVNFALNVGVAVPSSIRLSRLPGSIVSIVPQYRDYDYFVTDERIVIVEPTSHQIVEVLPFEGGGRAAAAPGRRRDRVMKFKRCDEAGARTDCLSALRFFVCRYGRCAPYSRHAPRIAVPKSGVARLMVGAGIQCTCKLLPQNVDGPC